jgi:hypothetical protein
VYEFSVNRLAAMFDVDRQTMVRALKDTPADAGSERKPLFRVSTAVDALHRHTKKPDGRRQTSNGVVAGDIGYELQRMFIQLDSLREKIAATATVKERIRLLREKFFPLLAATGRAMREDGDSVNEDDVRLTLRVEAHERTQMLTLRHLVNWNSDRMFYEFNKATSSDGEAIDPEELVAALFKQSLGHDGDEAT